MRNVRLVSHGRELLLVVSEERDAFLVVPRERVVPRDGIYASVGEVLTGGAAQQSQEAHLDRAHRVVRYLQRLVHPISLRLHGLHLFVTVK